MRRSKAAKPATAGIGEPASGIVQRGSWNSSQAKSQYLENQDDIAEWQARRIARTFLMTYATAAVVAQLAWGGRDDSSAADRRL
jgi:hypothetical protein